MTCLGGCHDPAGDNAPTVAVVTPNSLPRCPVRRSMRSLIVAMLCLTLGVDTAKACWLWRHRGRQNHCRPAVHCPPPCPTTRCDTVGTACGEAVEPAAIWQPVAIAAATAPSECPCETPAEFEAMTRATEPVQAAPAADATAAPESPVVHGATLLVDAPPTLPPGPPAAPELEPEPTPDQRPVSVLATTPAQPMPPADAAVPAAEPPKTIAPASNEQPAAEPAAAPLALELPSTTPPMPAAPVESLAVAPPVAPPEPNLFDLYDDEAAAAKNAPAADTSDAVVPVPDARPARPADAAPQGEPEMVESDSAAPPAGTPAPSADTPRPADGDAAPADAAPAEEAGEQPAAPAPADATADASRRVAREPLRRWSDVTGSHSTQGWLVAVAADRVRILKLNGRHTTIGIAALSAADREYVTAVGERLADLAPDTATATAGL